MSRHRTLSRRKMLDFFDDLEKYPITNGYSLYLPLQLEHSEVRETLQEISVSPEIEQEISDIVEKSHAGGIIYWSNESKYLVLPPFPTKEKLLFEGVYTQALKSILSQDYLIGIILVRLGAYAVGVCRGEELISSKVGTGNIHGRHKKGGSSAHRFERYRDKQIEYFFTRVCHHAREHLEPYEKSLDYLVYGGARTTIRELQKQCSFLGKLNTPTLQPLLDIPEPRQPVLKKALSRVWSSTLYGWREED